MKLLTIILLFLSFLTGQSIAQLDHWETVVNDNSSWYYKVPTSTTSALWTSSKI